MQARGGRVDIRIILVATYDSPFDPDEIAVDALVRAPPGAEMTVPAFFDHSAFGRRCGACWRTNSPNCTGTNIGTSRAAASRYF